MKVRLLAMVSASLILAGCAGSVKPDTVKAANGSSIEIYSVSAIPELNNNRVADSHLREVTPAHESTLPPLEFHSCHRYTEERPGYSVLPRER